MKVFSNKELRNKLLITLFLLTIYKIGVYISAPFINKDYLASFTMGSDFFALSDLISGGALSQFSIFALGVMPYITVSIVIQLLSFNIVPFLSEWRKQGEMGQLKVKRLTIYLSIVIAFIQGIVVAVGFNSMYSGIVSNDVWWVYLIIGIVLMLGTCILIYFGHVIDKKGIGNGLSIVIFGSILMSMPSTIGMYYESSLALAGENLFIEVTKAIIILLAIVLLIAFIVFITLSERRIPVHYSGQIGDKQSSNETRRANILPIKILSVGVIPVIFAAAIIVIPSGIAQMFPSNDVASFVLKYFSLNNLVGNILYITVIVIFTYLYTFLQMNPKNVSKNLSESGAFIPSIRPGLETELYLRKMLIKMSTMGAFVLALVALAPTVFASLFNLPLSIQIGGISLIIIVNVALDVKKRIESYETEEDFSSWGSNGKSIFSKK